MGKYSVYDRIKMSSLVHVKQHRLAKLLQFAFAYNDELMFGECELLLLL